MRRDPAWRDSAAAAIVLAAIGAEFFMLEWFQRVSAQSFKLVGIVVLLLLVPVIFLLVSHRLRAHSEKVSSFVSRLGLVAAAAVFLALLLQPNPDQAAASKFPGTPGVIWLVAICVLLCAAWWSPVTTWQRLRRAITVAAVAFVGCQPLLVAIKAPHVQWPATSAEPGISPDASGVTVFLLLDELSANASARFVDTLAAAGLEVAATAMRPVADGTARVIPALFTQLDFSNARPCSFTATCSGGRVLDFARIVASRPDIDVVGFFHPYCAIRQLRWCERGVVAQAAFDADRWRCAFWRRTGLPLASEAMCQHAYRVRWREMTERIVDAVWRAPVWTRGGMLFAHIPLPHPPGNTESTTVAENYEENLARSNDIIREMARRAQQAGGKVRIVIFSDHPFRRAMWCGIWLYASYPCPPAPSIDDDRVPLIVAGTTLPRLDDIRRNDQVFELAPR